MKRENGWSYTGFARFCIWKPQQAPYIALKVGVLSFLATLWLPMKIRMPQNQMIKRHSLYSKRDLNPHSHHWPRDFKSLVSTDSTIRAAFQRRAENETRTRDPNLGKVVLYQLSYFRIDGCKCRDFYATLQTFPPFFSFKRMRFNGPKGTFPLFLPH